MLFYYNNTSLNEVIFFILKNGFHFHFLHIFLYMVTQDLFLSSIIVIKLYSINYFYWFGNHYNFFPQYPRLNWVKQFVRLTDTGHFASFLLYLFPNSIPLAHNVHFLIMTGYWGGKLLFQVEDADRISNSDDIVLWHSDLLAWTHHTLPYMLVAHKLYTDTACHQFDSYTLLLTVAWTWSWFFCIYLPWRALTGDPVYSILDIKKTSPKTVALFMAGLHGLMALANWVGGGRNYL